MRYLNNVLVIGALLALQLLGGPASAVAADDTQSGDGHADAEPKRMRGFASEGFVAVEASSGERTLGGSAPVSTVDRPQYEFRRMVQTFCGTLDAVATTAPCVEGTASGRVVRYCADGSEALDPLFRREVDGVTGQFVGAWEQIDAGGCPEDAPADPVILSAEEFRRLPLAASVPQFQPADGRGLVNMDLIVFTDAAEQTLATTVLGVPVMVRATPVRFSWDFGDGSDPMVTTDPGAPYPAYSLGHPYRQPGTYAVELTTTWSGEFQVNGVGPWLPVDGTATTTSPPFTAEVLEAHAHLVAEAGRP